MENDLATMIAIHVIQAIISGPLFFVVLGIPCWMAFRKTGLRQSYVFLLLIPVIGFTVVLHHLAKKPWPNITNVPDSGA